MTIFKHIITISFISTKIHATKIVPKRIHDSITGSNKKERRRTQSINNAFASLRDCIPNVPCDTKLSKIKTLRLATSYIDYLMQLLNSENVSSNAIAGFKADIHKRWKEKSEEQKRRELVRISAFIVMSAHFG